jgi:hypothetical protein
MPASTAFAGMIGNPLADGGRTVNQDSAMGFAALGMFGRYGAVAEPSHALPTSDDQPAFASSVGPECIPVDGAVDAPIRQVARTAGSAESPPSATGAAVSRQHAQLLLAAPDTLAFDPMVAGGESVLDAADPDGVHGAGPGGPDLRGLVQRRSQGPTVRLSSPTDPVTALVVAAADLTEDDAERFHSRADALLREHGLALDKMTVNGEDRPSIDPWGRGSEQWR